MGFQQQPFIFTTPNSADHDGPDRVKHVGFAEGSRFQRNGGKAVEKHHWYQSAGNDASNLAGWAQVEQIGIAGGRDPESVADGDRFPVNFDGQATCVFPTSGDVEAQDFQVGHDFNLWVDAVGRQFIDLNNNDRPVLRLSKIVSQERTWVSCLIPDDLRYGNI